MTSTVELHVQHRRLPTVPGVVTVCRVAWRQLGAQAPHELEEFKVCMPLSPSSPYAGATLRRTTSLVPKVAAIVAVAVDAAITVSWDPPEIMGVIR